MLRRRRRPEPEPVDIKKGEENFSKLVEDLRTKMPDAKMSQMDIIQRDIKKTSEDMPIVQLVDAVFRQAVNKKASDIHIEPFTDHTEIRFRIDGVLRPVMTVPKELENSLISRIKVMANLDITENRQPQDGRVMTEQAGRAIDLRISTLPIIHGEKCVIRLLDKGANKFEFAKLGFSESAEATIRTAIAAPNGIILVTGPTGSGKSTTLYTALTALNSPERNIVTLEDPVEYQLARINQVQVNAKVGLTFAKGLRSILRQDPDVIMVGEIRDLETAEIAIQAALTGGNLRAFHAAHQRRAQRHHPSPLYEGRTLFNQRLAFTRRRPAAGACVVSAMQTTRRSAKGDHRTYFKSGREPGGRTHHHESQGLRRLQPNRL